ncbi:Rv2175c family DNA-binding protein [Nocardioides sp. CPCC 205120]|uniref:Rv2175c family DNA-binding protein n=1 Tax=Nocardioides sp. CPCC 205120 TaxID=3406462 RepID=UPI003B512D88
MDSSAQAGATGGEPTGEADLGTLVEEWVDWAEAARRLGVTVSRVRTLIRDNQLAAAVPAPGAGQQVPAAFIQDGLLLKGLPGLVVMLSDHGYDHREIIEWLYTDLDLPGRPIDALVENRGAEVKRRAQAMH